MSNNKQFQFKFNGKLFETDKPQLNLQELRQIVGESQSPIVRKDHQGRDERLGEHDPIHLGHHHGHEHHKPEEFGCDPDFNRGLQTYLEQELELIGSVFSEAQHLGGGVVYIPKHPLPEGVYNRPFTGAFVVVPPLGGRPDNFWVDPGLTLADGSLPGNFTAQSSIAGRPAGFFSWHLKNWCPGGVAGQGDNMLSFLTGVKRRLWEGR